MSQKILVIISLVFVSSSVLDAGAGLTLTKQCGDIVCQSHSYCSATDHVCRPCEVVCDTSHNNHDKDRCESDCQDYLHDIRYLKLETRPIEMQIGSELWTLKLLLGVTIAMTTTLMLLTVTILLKLHFKRSKKRKGLELPAVIYSNKYEKTSNPPSAIMSRSEPENNNRFRREPSESTLPEYTSYDNPALAPSPTIHV